MALAQKVDLPYDLPLERSIEMPKCPKLRESRNDKKRLLEFSSGLTVSAINIRNGQEYD
jgi:hypothetical protein